MFLQDESLPSEINSLSHGFSGCFQGIDIPSEIIQSAGLPINTVNVKSGHGWAGEVELRIISSLGMLHSWLMDGKTESTSFYEGEGVFFALSVRRTWMTMDKQT